MTRSPIFRTCHGGPSNIYRRLLVGQVTPERYVAVLKRAVDMGITISRKQRAMARELANNPRLKP